MDSLLTTKFVGFLSSEKQPLNPAFQRECIKRRSISLAFLQENRQICEVTLNLFLLNIRKMKLFCLVDFIQKFNVKNHLIFSLILLLLLLLYSEIQRRKLFVLTISWNLVCQFSCTPFKKWYFIKLFVKKYALFKSLIFWASSQKNVPKIGLWTYFFLWNHFKILILNIFIIFFHFLKN